MNTVWKQGGQWLSARMAGLLAAMALAGLAAPQSAWAQEGAAATQASEAGQEDGAAQDDGEDSGVVLPEINLKYQTMANLSELIGGITYDPSMKLLAPLLGASNGYIYGVTRRTYIDSFNDEPWRNGYSVLFRFHPEEPSNVEHALLNGPNRLSLGLVQAVNGDIYGVTDIGPWADGCKVTSQGTTCTTTYAKRGIVVVRAPQGDLSNIALLDIMRDAQGVQYGVRSETLSSTRTPTIGLTAHPDGHVYGLSYAGNGTQAGLEIYRLRTDNQTLEVVYRAGTTATVQGQALTIKHPLSIAVDAQGQIAVVAHAAAVQTVADAGLAPVGVLLRIDPANPPQDGSAAPVHVFTQAEVGAFTYTGYSGLNQMGAALNSGQLVDGADGYWYGNSGAHVAGLWDAANPGVIFRIRYDGSDFQVVKRLSSACGSEVAAWNDEDRFSNDDCYRDWPDGKTPVGALILANDGLIYGTTRNGGLLVAPDQDNPNSNTNAYSSSSYGLVFQVHQQYAGQEGQGYQVVRPFRRPVADGAAEAASPTGVTLGANGKLYGWSQSYVTSTAPAGVVDHAVAYSAELGAAEIDLTHTASSRMLPDQEFSVIWRAYRVNRCDAYSRTVPAWNGEIATSGTMRLSIAQAGNHKLEIVCQDATGTVYMERNFTVRVYSPPVTEEELLQTIEYGNGSGGAGGAGAVVFGMAVAAAWRRRRLGAWRSSLLL